MDKHDLSANSVRSYSFCHRGYFRLCGSGLPVFDRDDHVTISQGGVNVFGGFVFESSDIQLILDADFSWAICKKGVEVNGSPGFTDELLKLAGFGVEENRVAIPDVEVDNGQN